MDTAIIVALLSVVSGAILAVPGILAYLGQRKKTQADTAQSLTCTAKEVVAMLRSELLEVRAELDQVKGQNDLLVEQNTAITRQMGEVSLQNEVLSRRIDRVIKANNLLRAWAKVNVEKVVELGGIPAPEPDLPRDVFGVAI
jgi:chromosome segregation ATPase